MTSSNGWNGTFDRIYASNGWNGTDSLSGPGSSIVTTRRVDKSLRFLVEALNVRSVLDVGCGDNLWMTDLPDYLGIDVSNVAIERARVNHPERRYEVRNASDLSDLPAFDLVICRDVLQHVPFAVALDILEAIKQTNSRTLLASTYLDTTNEDVAEGEFYSPDLTAEPFSLPTPDLLVFDGFDYEHGEHLRDARKFLGVWSIAMLGAT